MFTPPQQPGTLPTMQINFHGGEAPGDVFIVETIAEAGHVLQSHRHAHGHTSVLVKGAADVTVAGSTTRYSGYNIVEIPADTEHCVMALEPIVWLCIWAGDVAPRALAQESLKLIPKEN